jgi:uncharacterized membrane protein YbhN (UPF0104 family)
LKWIAWPVFLFCLYFLFVSFTSFVQQYPSAQSFNVQVNQTTVSIVFAVALLCIANWWLESVKWKMLVNRITPCSFNKAAQSVLMGCSFGFITPNRIGDYAGRTVPFDPELKTKIVTLNIISGFSQFLGVVLAGLTCSFFYNHQISFFSSPVIISAIGVFILVLGVFIGMGMYPQFVLHIVQKLGIKNKHIISSLTFPPFTLISLLHVSCISLLRAVVFIIQLVLVISVFSNHVDIIQVIAASGVYFMVLTVSPSLVFNKLGLREALSVLILAPVTGSPVMAALSVFILWFVNQVIPVLLGSLLLIKRSVHQTS